MLHISGILCYLSYLHTNHHSELQIYEILSPLQIGNTNQLQTFDLGNCLSILNLHLLEWGLPLHPYPSSNQQICIVWLVLLVVLVLLNKLIEACEVLLSLWQTHKPYTARQMSVIHSEMVKILHVSGLKSQVRFILSGTKILNISL